MIHFNFFYLNKLFRSFVKNVFDTWTQTHFVMETIQILFKFFMINTKFCNSFFIQRCNISKNLEESVAAIVKIKQFYENNA